MPLEGETAERLYIQAVFFYNEYERVKARVKELEETTVDLDDALNELSDMKLRAEKAEEAARQITISDVSQTLKLKKAEAWAVDAEHVCQDALDALKKAKADLADFRAHVGSHDDECCRSLILKRAAGRESGATDGDVTRESGGSRETISHNPAPTAAAKPAARIIPPPPEVPHDPPRQRTVEVRIADALERIADALEKL